MARGGLHLKKRTIAKDPIYHDELVSRFVNRLMHDGKKTIAQKVVYDAFDIIKEKGSDPLKTFHDALENVSPKVEVRARRIGGAAYQVPTEVRGERKTSLAIRWLLAATVKRSNKEYHGMSEKLAAELMDAVNNLGEAIRKRDVTHRMAEANKAFSHFRW